MRHALAALFTATVCAASAAPAAADPLTTVAGTGVAGFAGDAGPATAAQLSFPVGVTALSSGGYLIADQVNHRVRRVAVDGTITTVAGNGTAGFSGDGGAATAAQLSAPSGLAIAADGSILIADANNNRIRRVTPGGVISTVAGGGGGFGDGGPATSAQLAFPYDIATQSDGSYLIVSVDQHRIRRVSPGGVISTVAGTGVASFGGDGGAATAAQLNKPFGVSLTADGGYLIADRDNQRIRKVTAGGTISTVAGTTNGFSGDGGAATAAQLASPSRVLATSDGGFVIADLLNHRIRRVTGGTITTIAGDGTAGFADAANATAGRLNRPAGIALSAAGDVLIADSFNHRARMIDVPGTTILPPELPPPVATPDPAPPSSPPPPPPVASFSAPTRASAFSPVLLNAGSTTGATRLQWDFDSDGKIDLTSPPRDSAVRLTVPGNKTLPVKLIVTGAGGATDTKVQNVTFTPSQLLSGSVLKQLPAVLTSGPAEISASTSILANRPCIDGTTVIFRLVEARGCFVRTEDPADVPPAERAVGQAHYFEQQYSVPAVVNNLCRRADLGELPQSKCDQAKAMFKKPQEFYVSKQAIKLNGITIRPRNGRSIVLLPAAERLLAADAVMIWNGITVKSGALDLNLVDQVKAIAFGQRAKDFPTGRAPLFTFDGNKDIPDIAGFKIDGAISLSIGATDGKRWSEGAISLRLPPAFSLFGGNPPSASTSLRADNDNDPVLDQLKVTVPEAYIGAVRFTDLSFEYRLAGGIDGDTNPGTSCTRKEWKARGNVFISGGKSGEAGFRLTAPPSQNGVGFCNGSFKHAGGALQFGGPIPKPVLFPGVLLDEVNFALQLNPFLVRGGGQISVGEVATVKGALLLAFPTASRPYVLNERDAGREFKQLAGKRFTSPTVAVGGDVGIKVPEFGTLGFGNAALMYSYPDYVFFGGQVRLILPGLAVTGGVSGEMSLATKRFQLGGEGEACLGIDVVCFGANANVGSRGFSACGQAVGLRPGGGYRFADKYIGIWPIDGCKPSQFWITDVRARTASGARAAQAGVLTFQREAGEAVKQLRLQGDTAAPEVTVRGPSGKALTVTGDDLTYAPGNDIGAMRELTGKRTFISLNDGPGRYTVTPEPGSAKITQVAESRKGYDSEFEGEIDTARNEAKRILKYDLGPKGGDQQVTFYEKGEDVYQQIGTAKSGKGEITFTPADGARGSREIVAVALINGVPIAEQTLAKFKASAEAAVTPPTDVEVQRRGAGLVVTWDKAEQAKAYGIVVTQANGEVQRHRASREQRSLRIAKVDAEFAGRVTVSAQGPDNDWTKPTEAARYKRTEAPFTVLQTAQDNEKRDAAKARAERARSR
ncbi:MAG: hypothetical protein JHC84_07870 [Solirubrobacteraceae bacterium]|nr:hypothetical protein [Solirubrobacteraceae bacterium]